jgi:hypothetical protein
LRPAPEEDGLVEVIFWPLLVGEIVSLKAPAPADCLLLHQR